jgi:hypothetical protein
MELLRDAEPVVEGAAAVFEEAGLGASAAALRSWIPIRTMAAAFTVAGILKEAQANEIVADLAFWTEGAILAGCDGDIDLFADCVRMCERVLVESWVQFVIH